MTAHKRKLTGSGPPRPRHSTTFNPSRPHSTQQPPASTRSTLDRMSSMNYVVTSIVRRNRNQHRTQRFWKWLALLRKSLSHLTALQQALARETASMSRTQTGAADAVRHRFERQAELRSQWDVYEEWTRETLVPNCYVAFSSVVADTQFANLGLVLMAVLADVVGVVGVPTRVESVRVTAGHQSLGRRVSHVADVTAATGLTGLSTLVTGPKQGEAVERIYDRDAGADADLAMTMDDAGIDTGVVVERPPLVAGSETGTGIDTSDSHADGSPAKGRFGSTFTTWSPSSTPPTVSVRCQTSRTPPGTSLDPTSASEPSTSDLVVAGPSGRTLGPAMPAVTSHKKAGHTRIMAQSASEERRPLKSLPATQTDHDQQHEANKKKEKRKKRNAIDDLFGGLV